MPRRSRSRSPRRVRGERRSRSRSPIRERRDAERGERRRDPERLDDRGLARDRTDRADRSDRVDRLDRADRGDRSDRVDRGDRSDRTERVDRRDRAGSSKQPVNGSGATGVAGKKRFTAEDFAGKNDDEIEMMKTMGFGGFDTSKGKKVDGNNAGAVHVHLKRTYRQYMNRRGGFNRPLDSVH